MSDKKQEITNKLHEFIELFKQFKEKVSKEDWSDKYDDIIDNFQTLISHYTLFDKQVFNMFTDEMFDSFIEMIDGIEDELKNNLNIIDESHNKNKNKEDLEKIDSLLSKQNINEKDIDKLLDMRSQLV